MKYTLENTGILTEKKCQILQSVISMKIGKTQIECINPFYLAIDNCVITNLAKKYIIGIITNQKKILAKKILLSLNNSSC